jgi:hypothetical protein
VRKPDDSQSPNFRFYEDPTVSSCMEGRLFTQYWDATMLSRVNFDVYWLLLIDWRGDVAYVIGKLNFYPAFVDDIKALAPRREVFSGLDHG